MPELITVADLAERMAEILKEEIKMDNIEIKEEIQEDILLSSTVQNTCTVNIKEEDVKNEFLGKFSCKTNIHKT